MKSASKEKLLKKAEELFESHLKQNSMFFTKERKIILEQIFQQSDHFSADELFFDLQQKKINISRSTVYNTLNQIKKIGILAEADFGHGHAHYELTLGVPNHIHLICSKTHKVDEVISDELEALIEKICKKNKFDLKYHKIQLFGQKK